MYALRMISNMINKVKILLELLFLYAVSSAGEEKIDGGWTSWSILSDSDCSAPCGGGEETKVRTCTNPKPQNGGADCEGPDKISVPCNDESCDDKMANSEWEEWSPCSTTCGKGKRERVKKCVNGDENGYQCEKIKEKSHEVEECKEWSPFIKEECPSPCDKNYDEYQNIDKLKHCPDRAKCDDLSDDLGPKRKCKCVMGYELDERNWICKEKPPVKPTPRPIPTLSPVQKVVAVVVTKTASTVLLVMVSLTLALFIIMRIFTVDRVIQMNMEFALLIAHLFLLFPNDISTDNPDLCQVVSIALHFFFTACFMFMLLEALHVYSMVAFVVSRNGLLSRFQNMLVGWGVSVLIIIVGVCFFLEYYGAEYHCWTQMDKPLSYLTLGPITAICILNFIMLEAAGNANYKPLKIIDHRQLLSCKIHQRSNLILMPLIFASFVIGMVSDYEQNLALYSVFSILNTVIGVLVFLFHCLGNDQVRQKVKNMFKCCFRQDN
ncbi:adhesion G-protein coupled receptor G6-like [Uloborus diversus]|uniref:adhesion G-protein coupled receptor G6-like n=1 Tax=Uloborus diversus TaxID=327109 RepID=UPI002409EEE1|nr:adhesion G-protein coupled receptor G6-like [Uloborus diversus]